MQLELASETDFEGFRRAARSLLAAGQSPDAVQWRVADAAAPELPLAHSEPAVADVTASAVSPGATVVKVPPDFIALCREVVLHSDPTRFALLYRLLWRLQHEPGLRHDAVDPELLQARAMAQAVRRDLHKMKAFVRFREIAQEGDANDPAAVLHVAWFEPEHHIVEAVAPFFMRRFTAMRFAILTPERCVNWDGEQLEFSPGAKREDAPPADAGEALWLTYYRSIFNPARLKLRAMEKEMPRKYWHNLPEASLISSLAAGSSQRTGTMIESDPTAPRALSPVLPAAKVTSVRPAALLAGASAAKRLAAWQAQRAAASGCRECPIGALATQTVWGEGPIDASLMLVGEQPGDQEDLRGHPFVGPAGQLLNRAMAQLGWDRSTVYVTNSVKHFKYEPRGKRRMHKTAAQKEADACLHWMEAEIELVQPRAIVALGATAARQLMGRPVAVTRERGHWLRRHDGVPVLVTLHPSALLRTDAADRDAAYAAWIEDLRLATRPPAAPR